MKIIRTTYRESKQASREIRDQVFVQELSIPQELEEDQRDFDCIHVVVWKDKQPVGTGRIDIAKEGKLGRVAVKKSLRGRGIGKQIMRELELIAKEYGLPEVWFHAQKNAVTFYEPLGYNKKGSEFLEADIIHQLMEKKIQ